MGKISDRIKAKNQLRAARKDEGLLRVSFVFDGRTYSFEHFFKPGEVDRMKELCRDHGEVAGQQLVWRGAINYASTIAENALAAAGFDYVQRHHKGNASGNLKAELERAEAEAAVTYEDVVREESANETGEKDS